MVASVVESKVDPYDGRVATDQSVAMGGVRSSLTIGASIAMWSLGSFAFFLLAGRMLGPVAYGLAAALLGVIVVGSTPIIALQWSAARVVAAHPGAGRTKAMATYRRALILSTSIAFGLAVIASAVTIGIAASGVTVPTAALVLTYFSIVSVVPLLIALGALQGQHRYSGFAWSYASTGVLRAPLLVLLVLLPVADVDATVLAVGAAFLFGAVWAVALTRRDLRVAGSPDRETWRDFRGALPAAGVALTGIAMLTNVDVIAGKLSLGATEAGLFGAASVIAKALLVVPQALTIVLLPRVAEREAEGRKTGSLLAAGILVMTAAGLLAMAICYPLEIAIIDIAFGSEYEAAAPLLIPFIGATTLLGALLILVNHHVARSDHRFAWAVGGLAVLQVLLLAFFSTSAGTIILIDAVVAAIGLLIHEMIYFNTDESMLRGAGAQLMAILRRIRNRDEASA